MKNFIVLASVCFAVAAAMPSISSAHCQIPCGIYDDSTQFKILEEHILTMEKAIDQINSLSSAAEKNYNQLVRWINNKDDHADKFMESISQYFLAQRITPIIDKSDAKYEAYLSKITLLHRLIVLAMKCKQTVDRAHTDSMREALGKFKALYFQ
jgi:hypothetical protein